MQTWSISIYVLPVAGAKTVHWFLSTTKIPISRDIDHQLDVVIYVHLVGGLQNLYKSKKENYGELHKLRGGTMNERRRKEEEYTRVTRGKETKDRSFNNPVSRNPQIPNLRYPLEVTIYVALYSGNAFIANVNLCASSSIKLLFTRFPLFPMQTALFICVMRLYVMNLCSLHRTTAKTPSISISRREEIVFGNFKKIQCIRFADRNW